MSNHPNRRITLTDITLRNLLSYLIILLAILFHAGVIMLAAVWIIELYTPVTPPYAMAIFITAFVISAPFILLSAISRHKKYGHPL